MKKLLDVKKLMKAQSKFEFHNLVINNTNKNYNHVHFKMNCDHAANPKLNFILKNIW